MKMHSVAFTGSHRNVPGPPVLGLTSMHHSYMLGNHLTKGHVAHEKIKGGTINMAMEGPVKPALRRYLVP